jgi:hypothetical protein
MRKHPVWEEHPLVHGHDEWIATAIAVIGFILCWAGVTMLFASIDRPVSFAIFLAGLAIGAYGAIRGGHARHG